MTNTLTKLHVATSAWMLTTIDDLKQRKEAGQTSAEMLGLILVVASALFIGGAALGGDGDKAGPVVKVVTGAMAAAIGKALEALGIASGE